MPRFTPAATVASVKGPFPPAPPAPGAATAQAAAAGGANPMTLDALMLRQKEIAGQQQGAGGLNNGTIWGGLGSMAQSFLGGVRGRANENEINQAQQDIAANFPNAFNMDTGDINQQALQAIGARSPETMQEVYKMAMQARQHAEELDLQKQKLAAEQGGGAWKPSDIGALRDDYVKSAGTYDNSAPTWQSMQDSWTRVKDLKEGDTSPGAGTADYALVIGLAKLMDPNSVVREGEVETVRRTGGVTDSLIGMLNTLTGGGSLSPAVRRGLMTEASTRMKSYYDQVKQKRDAVVGIATRHGVNPDDVVYPLAEFKGFEQQAAPPNEIPADPNDGVPEGKVIVDDNGNRYKRQGDKWVRVP